MSWNNQVSAEESRSLAFGVICALQASLSTSLMSHGPNHRMAEFFFFFFFFFFFKKILFFKN